MLALTLVLAVATLVAATPLNVTSRQLGTQTGDATYYDVGLGACGQTNTPNEHVAAVSSQLFNSFPGYNGNNPTTNPICGQSATARYNGKSIKFTVVGSCVSCAYSDLDLSTSAFISLTGSLGVGRLHGVTWSLDGTSGPPGGGLGH